jgi:hypothetical protein
MRNAAEEVTVKAILLIVVSTLCLGSASAQDDFTVTAENKWVIEALAKMQTKGLLVGYQPFTIENSPHQARTRIVLASATHAAYLKLQGMLGDIRARIEALDKRIAAEEDLESLRAELTSIKLQVEAFHDYDKNVRDLIKLSHYFFEELRAQGVDYIAMRRDLKDMTLRYCSGYRSYVFVKDDPRMGAKYKPRK